MSAPTRVAFVRDWLTVMAGADRVMDAMLEPWPQAPIYALVYQPWHFRETRIARHPVRTSFIDRLPGGRRHHRLFLPLMPLAVEQFDLRQHDLVVSLSHAVAKGALTRADQLHVSYVLTPARYAWDLHGQYLQEHGLTRGVRSVAARAVLHYLRQWDLLTAGRPDVLVAASCYVAARIRKLYRREAEVVYPPVEIERFHAGRRREDFYLTVSRFVPYKRVDLIAAAFTRLGLPLVIIGDGADARRVRRAAGPNVELLGAQPDAVVQSYMERCKAFVYSADEDFGIAVVEAQAAGAPVIAYGRGGCTETVIDGETGLFFPEQRVESLMAAVRRFEGEASRFDPEYIRLTTQRFGRMRFQREFLSLIEREWTRFTGRGERQARVAHRAELVL